MVGGKSHYIYDDNSEADYYEIYGYSIYNYEFQSYFGSHNDKITGFAYYNYNYIISYSWDKSLKFWLFE